MRMNLGEKIERKSCFDVTMNCYDGAEIRELLFYFPTCPAALITKIKWGLCRDDGLLILRNVKGTQIDHTRKKIIKTFKLDIETSSKVVDFLDLTFNLNNGTYKPSKKPNDSLLCINKNSNNPPQIINQLPRIISDRLSRNYSNKELFSACKGEYKHA